MSQTNELSTITEESAAFELLQRQANMLSKSTLVPREFQNNMANCAIGLNIAKQLGANAFMVIQNLDIIHGRPSFRGKFLIAMVNASGRFSPLQFRFDGEGDDYGCTAYAAVKETGEMVYGPKVDWNMVKGEGWLSKQGSKWKTMPDLMFRYRAGAYFANIYAPDITLGIQTSEEAYDMHEEPRQATGRVVESDEQQARPTRSRNPYLPVQESATEQAEQTETAADTETQQSQEQPAEPRGTLVFFEKIETQKSPETASKPWTKYTVHYTVPNGPAKCAATFSESIVGPILNADEGVQIRIETEPATNPKHPDKLVYLAVDESAPIEKDAEW